MNRVFKGIAAGFVATVVLSILMIIKARFGVLPGFNAIAMWVGIAHAYLGTPLTPSVGWVLHFLTGAVLWGVLFSVFYTVLPGAAAVSKALLFAVIAWVLMMVIFMPLAGAGVFAQHLGVPVAVAALILHLIWGLVLGVTFKLLL